MKINKKIVTYNKALFILKKLIITEKLSMHSDLRHSFAFEVSMDSNKLEIKAAAEMLFNGDVKSVNIIVRKGKTKRFKGQIGSRSDRKIALITFSSKPEVDFSNPIKLEK